MNEKDGRGGRLRPSLPEPMRQQLANAVGRWVGAHPHPDEALVHFGGGRALSPNEIAAAIEDPASSPEGQLILAVFAHALTELPVPERPSIDELVDGFLQGAATR